MEHILCRIYDLHQAILQERYAYTECVIEIGEEQDFDLYLWVQNRDAGRMVDAEGKALTFRQYQMVPLKVCGLQVRRVESPSYLAVVPRCCVQWEARETA